MLMQERSIKTFCVRPFAHVKITCEGMVSMCCHQGSNFLGSLFEKSFDDIWFGDLAEEIREKTRNNELHSMCNTIYCPFKYKDNLAAEAKPHSIKTRYPSQLEFDLHYSHCNFGGVNPTPDNCCFMCPRSAPNFGNYLKYVPDRTDELLEKVTPLVPHLELLNILGIAEPFWKDKMFQMLEQFDFQKYKNQIELWTVSNASLFDEKKQKRLLELTERTSICFSLDAATPETFSKIRRQQPNVFKTCCENIRSWCKRKNPNHIAKLHNNINQIGRAHV